MCACKDTQGFSEQLSKAKALTKDTGEIHVVFNMKAVNLNFIDKESNLNDELGICCYYLPDGTEKLYTSRAAANIDVTVDPVEPEAEELQPDKKPKK